MTIYQYQPTYWYYRNGVEWGRGGGSPTQQPYWLPFSTGGSISLGQSLTDYRDLNKNKDWRQKVARKQDATTAYYVRKINFLPMSSYAEVNIWNPLYGGIPEGAWEFQRNMDSLPTVTQGLEDSALADLANSRLKRKLNNRTQSFDLIVPLAEIGDLRRTIVGAANLTSNTVMALKNVKRGNLKKAWQQASDIWLTYSFGVSPMLRDIRDIGQSISSYLTRYDSIDRLTGSASRDWVSSKKYGPLTAISGLNRWSFWEFKHTLSYKYICGHRFTLGSANDYSIFDHLGISPARLVPSAWEATAFSWVLDYFGTIGDFLDDTFSTKNGQSVYVVRNRRYTIEGVGKTYYVKSGSKNVTQFHERCIPGFFNMYEFQRTSLAALPSRVLRFRTLDEMGFSGVTKLLNLTSVLAKAK